MKDLTDLVKTRDEELLMVKKQLEHLEKLNRNKHLGERQKLSDQVDDLKQKLESADAQISTLNRKLLLEGKSSKQRMLMENVKHKECQRNLMQALAEIERLTGLVDVNNVNVSVRVKYYYIIYSTNDNVVFNLYYNSRRCRFQNRLRTLYATIIIIITINTIWKYQSCIYQIQFQ